MMPNLISAFLVKVLTSQTTINLITDLARELAKRSDNKVDDVAVELIANVLRNGVESKD